MSQRETRPLTVYALCDPRIEGDGGIRYIGATLHVKKRLTYHLSRERTMPKRIPKTWESYAPVYFWIRELRKQGVAPALRVLQENAAAADEMRLIRHYRAIGVPILNVRPHPDHLTVAELHPDAAKSQRRQANEGRAPGGREILARRGMLETEELARILRLGISATYELVRSGRIRAVKVGRRRLIPVEEVRRFKQAMLEAQDR